MVQPEDAAARDAILNSLEKRWRAADQDVFIATVIVNPFFQASPFSPGPCFVVVHIKVLLSSLYTRFFKSQPPLNFFTEVYDYLTRSGCYSVLELICSTYVLRQKSEVSIVPFTIISVLTNYNRS